MIVEIREDLSVERAGFVRAFWTESLDAPTCVTVFGYASCQGSHRTIRACAAEVLRHYPNTAIYRNGRKVAA